MCEEEEEPLSYQHTCVNALMDGLMYASVSESMTSVTIAMKMTYTVVAARVRHMSTAQVRSSRRAIVYILKR